MAAVKVVFDDAAIKLWSRELGAAPQRALDLLAGKVTIAMKAACPVSPVQPAYAYPVPLGRSKGTTYQTPGRFGRGLALPKGPNVPRTRYPGDLPLRPSGYLRSSIHAFPQPDGSIIIGPTAPYAAYVNNGTPPHEIHSTRPWPLRNRATGQVFGPMVHHPGTAAAHFVERAAESIAGTAVRT